MDFYSLLPPYLLYVLLSEIDTLEKQQTEKIETEVKDVDRVQKHTGVRNTVQGVLLRHPIHTISYTIYSPTAESPPSKKETPRWRVLYRITRQLLHRVSIH
jgi:hypothetical protein